VFFILKIMEKEAEIAALNAILQQLKLPAMRKEHRLLYLLALLKLALPFLIQNPAYEPHRDEFLYLIEGRHMAWGYMEVPPMLSVFAWLTNLFGGGFFWIKFWPQLFGALTYVLVGRIIIAFEGKWFALVLGVLPFIVGAYLRLNYLFQPNSPEVFFWTLMAYGLVRYVQTGSNRGLYVAGVALGLGMMSKYSVSFYAASLLAGLLLTKERRILMNRHFYYALLIGLAIFLPNLIWQYNHGFPVVYHMKELERTQLQYVSPGSFLVDQVLMNATVCYVWLAGLIWVSFTRAGRDYRFIGWATLFVMLILLAGHGKSYYALGAYPILFAFGALSLERWAVGRLHFLRYVWLVVSLGLGVGFVAIALPFLPPAELAAHYAKTGIARAVGALRWEDLKDHPLQQDFSDMLSWKEMTQKVARGYAMLDSTEKTQTLLFCDNYGEAGAVNYYGPRYQLPAAYSDNASFLYWLPDSFFVYNNLLLVTDDRDEMKHAFIHEFASATVVDSITTPLAREYGSLIILFKGPSETFRNAFRAKIDKSKYKTTAEGAERKVEPNPLEQGGTLH
jgi:4-amino-4-deoxy-L-arabinose transferase-like glycosyltransferase